MTTETKTPEQKIWESMLNGTITFEEGRAALTRLRGAEVADRLVTSAMEQRQAGRAAGAAWTMPPAISGPIGLPPPRFDAKGQLIVNQGPRPEETEPFGAYQRGLAGVGRNAGIGGGAFGDYLQGRFAPTLATFLGKQALRGPLPAGEVEPQDAFQQYAQQYGGQDMGLQAQSTFQGLMNKLRGGDVSKLGEADPLRAFLTPSDAQMGQGLNLAREATRGRLGGLASRYLLPSNEDLLQQFQGGPTGAQNTDFMAYLQRAFWL